MEYNGYRIIHDGTFGMKSIQNIGRGALPNSLKGAFSTAKEAMKAIDRAGKVNTNGEELRTS
jgi:hypothetical protein